MTIPDQSTQPHAAEFYRWYEKEKAEKGLIDIKFCLGNSAQASSESVFAEVNSMLSAEVLEDCEIF